MSSTWKTQGEIKKTSTGGALGGFTRASDLVKQAQSSRDRDRDRDRIGSGVVGGNSTAWAAVSSKGSGLSSRALAEIQKRSVGGTGSGRSSCLGSNLQPAVAAARCASISHFIEPAFLSCHGV